MLRLSRAGFKKEFVRPAILPDWWDEDCASDADLLPDIEFRVARFLKIPLAVIKDASIGLVPHVYAETQLRRVRAVDRDRLGPAIHSAMQIAAAVVRNLREHVPEATVPPADCLVWRQQLERNDGVTILQDVLADLWERGIPVIPLEMLPAPSFQGLACIVEGRPVILLGHRHDEPGRVAFLVAHEVGHIAAGDCQPGQAIVDEDEEILDNSEIEVKADQFATCLLVGGGDIPAVDGTNFKKLAEEASQIERETGADASVVIFAWARRSGDYAKATLAVRALYRARGARRSLRRYFDRHVDTEGASESDRALLRCVHDEAPR